MILLAPESPFIAKEPQFHEVADGASTYEKTLSYLHNVIERSLIVAEEPINPNEPRYQRRYRLREKADSLQSIDRFVYHQRMISRDPVSYLIYGERSYDGRHYHIIRRLGDIAFGSSLVAIPGVIEKTLTLIITIPGLVVVSLAAIATRAFRGSWDPSLQAVIETHGTSVLFDIVRDALRAIPLAGHFLGKAYDIGGILAQDAISAIYTRINSPALDKPPLQSDEKSWTIDILRG